MKQSPPRLAKWLLEVFCSPAHDSVIGDFDEKYGERSATGDAIGFANFKGGRDESG